MANETDVILSDKTTRSIYLLIKEPALLQRDDATLREIAAKLLALAYGIQPKDAEPNYKFASIIYEELRDRETKKEIAKANSRALWALWVAIFAALIQAAATLIAKFWN